MSTVLIVDDHAAFRRQARALLEAAGHSVVGEAADGASAVEAAERLRPQLVLLDVGLPDVDGFEVARQIGEMERPPAVILTSSREASAYGPQLTAAPAVGFVPKEELSAATVATLLVGAPR